MCPYPESGGTRRAGVQGRAWKGLEAGGGWRSQIQQGGEVAAVHRGDAGPGGPWPDPRDTGETDRTRTILRRTPAWRRRLSRLAGLAPGFILRLTLLLDLFVYVPAPKVALAAC